MEEIIVRGDPGAKFGIGITGFVGAGAEGSSVLCVVAAGFCIAVAGFCVAAGAVCAAALKLDQTISEQRSRAARNGLTQIAKLRTQLTLRKLR